ncbi:MAG: hypothetical protein GX038_00830 [Erysipelothrix sp.]|nr:hypothetical protein [Erysipelothrix sp.]
MDFLETPEARIQRQAAYYAKMFPFGKEHEDLIKKIVTHSFSRLKATDILYHYFIVKEYLVDDKADQIKSYYNKARPKLTQEMQDKLMVIILMDINATDIQTLETYFNNIKR